MAKRERNNWLMPSRFFADPFSYWNSLSKSILEPLRANIFESIPVDVIDEGDSIRVKADIPGVKKEDIKLNVTKDAVSIKAESNSAEEKKGKNYYYSERRSASLYRSIALPEEIDPKTAKAKFENGTLDLVAKKSASSGATEVKIE